ncbi:hypothetical protein GMA11_07095 [Granulicatella sp. zg-ZJ]|uniref:NTP pyrophosphohydrolase MazG putative catalytic core domain-containing protein n=3 Tax=Streptococcus TaxID=1301 RepID=A0A6I4RBL2_9STRE|nr:MULTISPECIES: MazG-like family protein [Lactobacillales]MBS4750855.1 hypothetical protein [Carnobacteriaceae bacterium zg-ZUI78]QMI86415.1 hypothetical protein H1220_03440 [Carnobacteriaceae bacterium zg-84]MTB65215.1 hypothetical protein [Streptococcus sp. zg-86]MWV57216.1 hypothetical protein [Streptococcus sp. zg-70]NEW62316.1 hypothetical protein [Granulicatella sp. zg-ZJ]
MITSLKDCQKKILENKKMKGFNTTDIKFELLCLYGEVNELFQAYLKDDVSNIAEELADVAIFLLGISEILNVDLETAIIEKIVVNEKRIYNENGSKLSTPAKKV